jgi:hypothetical protein
MEFARRVAWSSRNGWLVRPHAVRSGDHVGDHRHEADADQAGDQQHEPRLVRKLSSVDHGGHPGHELSQRRKDHDQHGERGDADHRPAEGRGLHPDDIRPVEDETAAGITKPTATKKRTRAPANTVRLRGQQRVTNVVNSSRSRSGLASASSSFKNRAGSILGPTVIVMLHSRVLGKVHSKDHPAAVTYINNDTATDCSYTTLLDSTLPQGDSLIPGPGQRLSSSTWSTRHHTQSMPRSCNGRHSGWPVASKWPAA